MTTLMFLPKLNTSKTLSHLSTASNLGAKMRAKSAEVCFSMSRLIAFGAMGAYVGGLTARCSRSVRADRPASIQSRSASRMVRVTSSSCAATRAARSAFCFSCAALHWSRRSCFASWVVSLGNLSGRAGGRRISPHRWAKEIALPALSMATALRGGMANPVTVHLKWVKQGQSGKSFGTRLTQEYAIKRSLPLRTKEYSLFNQWE